jgi:hypothetical protein
LLGELAAHKPALIRRLAGSVHEPVHEPAEPSPDPETGNQAIMPPAGSWHRSIAWWPTPWRKRWADRTRVLQAEGQRSDRAEWAAFRATVGAINAAEAAGERINFQVPAGPHDMSTDDEPQGASAWHVRASDTGLSGVSAGRIG